MGVDLKLIGERYNIIVLLFFITYVLLQPPATVVLRKIGPRVFLPTITLLWGITMITFGFVKDWTDMLGLRLVLGVFEAGFFPGCAYLLSCWYPRYELQKRNAVFYLIGSMASAFAGILAYGLSQLKNHGSGPAWWGQHYGPTKANPDIEPGVLPGIAGWRWIFILEGVLTCVIALGAYFIIVDFPEKAVNSFGLKFLNKAESEFICARIEQDRHDVVPEEYVLPHFLPSTVYFAPRLTMLVAQIQLEEVPRRWSRLESLGIRLSLRTDDNMHIRHRLFLAHHSECWHGFRRRCQPVSRCPALCPGRHCYVHVCILW
jgi:MFS family permease